MFGHAWLRATETVAESCDLNDRPLSFYPAIADLHIRESVNLRFKSSLRSSFIRSSLILRLRYVGHNHRSRI